jgi:DNA invertase Pin-like site-specific DNA recombinase
MSQIAIYARFSSDKQSDASIDDQVRRCRAHLARIGADPDAVKVFSDYAVSGASLQRPGFEAMMIDVEAGRIASIVTEDLSRISRDFADSGDVFRRLQFARVPLISVADGIDTSQPGALLSYGMKSIMSAHYLADLADKTHRGLEGRFRAGKAAGAVPYGYRTERDDLGATIVVSASEAAIVIGIFEAYRDGGSYVSIATDLNDRGIPTPRARTKHRGGRGWVANTVRAILRNEKYSGRWAWNKTQWVKRPGTNARVCRKRDESEIVYDDRPELAIVPPDLWEAVARRVKKTRERYHAGGRPKHRTPYPLSGLLFCGWCGAPMIIDGSSSSKRYRCGDNRKRGTCDNRLGLREDVARRGVLDVLGEHLFQREGVAYLRERIAVELGRVSRAVDVEIDRVAKRLEETEAQVAKLVDFIADGRSSNAIARRLADLESGARDDAAKLEDLRRQAHAPIVLPEVDKLVRRGRELVKLVADDPVAARERLAAYFADGRIDCEPQDDASAGRRCCRSSPSPKMARPAERAGQCPVDSGGDHRRPKGFERAKRADRKSRRNAKRGPRQRTPQAW